ncbi:ComEC/Rec2 family competence protein [Cellulomonas fengjieae]|uniref:ComEC/Rec2 family competence protein n=1 Tax=Cellulomonas fengjieae TaxID=2819978 RepID=A0ABS3SE05_9CELL|nr:ComEC/Rec2 family competence protein [Cellulomonas fengjieae]MBO3083979.1 ComEC/Rec2 family competence protein [Cellulomonas fengjieae]QVI64754.1 ComEC/Rec2 family competence protein [Cellulomonas fengjieae]
MTRSGPSPTTAGDSPPDDSDPPITVDVRLLPAAAAAWVAALVVARVAPAGAALAAALCLAVGITVLVRSGPATAGSPASRRAVGPVVALALVAGSAVLGAGATQVAARGLGLLPDLVRERAVGRVEGVVVAEPTVLAPAWPGAPERVRCLLAVDRVTARGRSSAATGQVLVVGPSSWAELPRGAHVAASGRLRPGEPGRRTVAVLLSSAPPDVRRPPSTADSAAARFRGGVRDLAAALPGDAGALLAGVTIGDTGAVPDDLEAALRTAGLTHVTAVSGAHFSLVAALVLALASAMRLPRAARAGLTVLAMAAMVLVVHPSASVLRAAAMGLVAVLGILLGRPHRAPAALAATVVVLLVADPWLAGELGFVLSVLATGALVLLGGPLAERWATAFGRPVATALALPVAAQLVCAPVILLLTPAVSLYAVPANVLVAPAVAPATVLGLAAGCVAPWWTHGAQVLALGAGAACWWIGAVGRVAAAAPASEVAWLPGWAGFAVLAAAGGCLFRVLLVHRTRERR